MKLTDMIEKIGDDKIRVQKLDDAITDAKGGRGKPTFITFGTDVLTIKEICLDKPKMFGVIVWLPRKEVEKLLKP